MKTGAINLASARLIRPEHFEEWTQKADPQPYDVVLSRRCNPGVTAAVRPGVRFALGQNLVLLRADGTRVYPPYLKWLVQSPYWWDQIGKYLNVGAVFDSLRCRDVPKFELPLPPLDEQRRIAAVLGALDDKIELTRRMNKTLEEMAQAIFKSWFIDFDEYTDLVDSELGPIPRGWQGGTVAELQAKTKNATAAGPFGSKLTRRHYTESGVPVIRGVNLGSSIEWFHDADFVYVSDEYARELTSSWARRGDVLFTQRGTLGQVGLIPSDSRFTHYILSQSQMKLTCADGIPPIYVFLYFRQRSTIEYLLGNAVAAGVPHINLTFLRNFPIVIPDKGTLDDFAQRVAPLASRIRANGRQNQVLAELRDALLPKLISGEIRVPEAEAQLELAI